MAEPNGLGLAQRDGESAIERRESERQHLGNHAPRPLRRAVALLLLAALLQLSPAGVRLEEQLGLPLLFAWRGAQTPPPEVALVTLDEASAIALDLPDLDQLEQWPRTLHAQLIRNLTAAGASVIAMDIAFLTARDPAADAELAAAMADSSNVIILKLLHRASVASSERMEGSEHAEAANNHQVTWQQEPLAQLRRHANVTTFTLPDRALGRQAALFVTTPEGREATLPVVALLRHLRHAREPLLTLLRDTEAPALAQQLMQIESDAHFAANLRAALLDDMALSQRLAAAITDDNAQYSDDMRHDLQRLLAAVVSDTPAYINFYGPQHTIRTVPLHRVLQEQHSPEVSALRGAIVFIGLSERIQKQRDYFFTAYSAYGDGRLSGVEVAATLTGNLLQQRPLRLLPGWQQLILLLVWGTLLAAAALRLRPLPWLAALLFGCLLYGAIAHWLFGAFALWLPIAVPLGLCAPALLFYALWHHYRTSAAAETAARETLGLYVPADLAATVGQHRQTLLNRRHRTDAFCLLTDIVGFTTFSELHDPDTVHQLMNRYYRDVVAAVDDNGGSVANIVGDGLLALWPVEATEGPERDHQCRQQAERACAAAQAIIAATDRLDAGTPDTGSTVPFTTCAGLHFGSVSLGNLGAGSHYEYAPVGDAINTTARVEACNRRLGTRILLTAAVQQWLEPAALRDLGSVELKGKRLPLQLFELAITAPR